MVDYSADDVTLVADAALFAYTVRLHMMSAPPPPSYARIISTIYRTATAPYLIDSLGAWEARSHNAVARFARGYRALLGNVPDVPRAHFAGLTSYLYNMLVHADLFDRTARIVPYDTYASFRQALYAIRHVFLVARPGATHFGVPAFEDDELVSTSVVYPLLAMSLGRRVPADQSEGGVADEA